MGLTRGEHKGNMIIHFHVQFPEKLSEEHLLVGNEYQLNLIYFTKAVKEQN